MREIEQIKQRGATIALKNEIHSLIFELSHVNWHNIKNGDIFCCIGDAIKHADILINRMYDVLQALQEIEPENK